MPWSRAGRATASRRKTLGRTEKQHRGAVDVAFMCPGSTEAWDQPPSRPERSCRVFKQGCVCVGGGAGAAGAGAHSGLASHLPGSGSLSALRRWAWQGGGSLGALDTLPGRPPPSSAAHQDAAVGPGSAAGQRRPSLAQLGSSGCGSLVTGWPAEVMPFLALWSAEWTCQAFTAPPHGQLSKVSNMSCCVPITGQLWSTPGPSGMGSGAQPPSLSSP